MRTTLILPPDLYRNMNGTSILKNRAPRHVPWTKRRTPGPALDGSANRPIRFVTTRQ